MTAARSEKRKEFVRLTNPDERSLLAFKCWLRETRQGILAAQWTCVTPTLQPMAAAIGPVDAGSRSVLDYQAKHRERELQAYEDLARSHLQLGHPRVLELPDGAALAQTIAKLSCANAWLGRMLKATHCSPQDTREKIRQDGAKWQPSRKVVTETVMGTFVTLSERLSALVDTAHHLRAGLPEREHGISSEHVRDAIRRFASDNYHHISTTENESARLLALLCLLGNEEMIADQLWVKVKAASKPRPVSIAFIEQLFDEGILLEWLSELEAVVGAPHPRQLDAAFSELQKAKIHRLYVEQKKLPGGTGPKNSRKPPLFSRSATADASSPLKETEPWK